MTRSVLPAKLITTSLLVMGLVLAWPTLASLGEVSDLFKSANYAAARSALSSGGEGARPGEEILWQARLATDPDEAIGLLEDHRLDKNLPDFIRQRMALELAELNFARGQYRACLTVLSPILDPGNTGVSGEAYLLAGLTYRLLGDTQSAREMLASVRPDDPAFSQARFYLGDISLQLGDAALAQRYFQSGTQSETGARQPSLQAGLWLAHRQNGDMVQAEGNLESLRRNYPGSLALLEINRTLRQETEERDSRVAKVSQETETVTAPVDQTGRYSLQFGAFNDRALALEFQRRLERQVPEVRIDSERDDRGQFLYKVRTGSYVNPALARTEAAKLARQLDVEVIVADLATSAGRGQ